MDNAHEYLKNVLTGKTIIGVKFGTFSTDRFEDRVEEVMELEFSDGSKILIGATDPNGSDRYFAGLSEFDEEFYKQMDDEDYSGYWLDPLA